MENELERYIRENRDTYTREVITRQLIEAGHDPAEVERAWETVELQADVSGGRQRFSWRDFAVAVAGLYGLTFLAYLLWLLVGQEDVYLPAVVVLSGILFFFLAAGAWVSVNLVSRNWRGTASGLLTALVLPFVFLVIVAGLCLSLTG